LLHLGEKPFEGNARYDFVLAKGLSEAHLRELDPHTTENETNETEETFRSENEENNAENVDFAENSERN
jgi:hypothetical protein